MRCAICDKHVCNHRSHRVSGPVWTCSDCGQFGINGPAPVYCLPIYEGRVSLASDVYFTVCKECHDAANESLQPTPEAGG